MAPFHCKKSLSEANADDSVTPLSLSADNSVVARQCASACTVNGDAVGVGSSSVFCSDIYRDVGLRSSSQNNLVTTRVRES